MRRVEPTSVGTATRVKSCAVEKWKPALFRLTAVMLHRTHTEKARNSAKMEKVMLRRATARPWRSQNSSSSGLQCSIHGLGTCSSCPRRAHGRGACPKDVAELLPDR